MPPLFLSYSREQGARQITPLGLNECIGNFVWPGMGVDFEVNIGTLW